MARALHLTMTMTETKDGEFEKCREILRGFKSGMLVTHSVEGEFHARPMMLAEVDDTLAVSFVTSLESPKVEEILRDASVGITLQGGGAFLAITGTALLITALEERKRVFGLMTEAWFDGPEDLDAAVIRVVPHQLEYWDGRGINALRLALKFAKSALTGEKPNTDEREHGTLRV